MALEAVPYVFGEHCAWELFLKIGMAAAHSQPFSENVRIITNSYSYKQCSFSFFFSVSLFPSQSWKVGGDVFILPLYKKVFMWCLSHSSRNSLLLLLDWCFDDLRCCFIFLLFHLFLLSLLLLELAPSILHSVFPSSLYKLIPRKDSSILKLEVILFIIPIFILAPPTFLSCLS